MPPILPMFERVIVLGSKSDGENALEDPNSLNLDKSEAISTIDLDSTFLILGTTSLKFKRKINYPPGVSIATPT